MGPLKISWITAISGFIVLAFVLAGEGFLLSTSLGDQFGETRPVLSNVAIKLFSHRAFCQ